MPSTFLSTHLLFASNVKIGVLFTIVLPEFRFAFKETTDVGFAGVVRPGGITIFWIGAVVSISPVF